MSNSFCICGNFKPSAKSMCDQCNEDYTKIRSFIEANPKSTIMEVVQETKISYIKIKLFTDKGLFSIKQM